LYIHVYSGVMGEKSSQGRKFDFADRHGTFLTEFWQQQQISDRGDDQCSEF